MLQCVTFKYDCTCTGAKLLIFVYSLHHDSIGILVSRYFTVSQLLFSLCIQGVVYMKISAVKSVEKTEEIFEPVRSCSRFLTLRLFA